MTMVNPLSTSSVTELHKARFRCKQSFSPYLETVIINAFAKSDGELYFYF